MPMLGIMASAISGNLWAPAGAYDSISSVTLSASASSITFSGIPATYTHLQIRGIMAPSGASSSTNIQFNSDTTTTNYYYHRLQGDGANTNAGAGNLYRILDGTGTTTYYQSFVIDILDYANTNKYKTTRALAGYDANGSGQINLTSNLWKNTNAITTITFTLDTPNINTYSSFALYGVK